MASRIRENVPDDPVSDRHVCKSPPEWILFNLARRICQIPSKESRQKFVANLRFVETPEFVIDLEREVRRQFPMRNQPTRTWLKTFESTVNGN